MTTVRAALISTSLLSISTSPPRRRPRGAPRQLEPLDERLRDPDCLRTGYLEDGWTVARMTAETGAQTVDIGVR